MKYNTLSAALKDAVETDLDNLCEEAKKIDDHLVSADLNNKMLNHISKKNKRIHIPSSLRRVACIAATFVIVIVCSVNVDAYKEKSFEFLPIVTPDSLILYTIDLGASEKRNDVFIGNTERVEMPKYELVGLDDGYELTGYHEHSWNVDYTYEKGDLMVSFHQSYFNNGQGIYLPLENCKKYWIKENGIEYFVQEIEHDGVISTDLIWGIDKYVFSLFTSDLSLDEALRLAENIRLR